jgi:hypothetical protein
MAALTPGSLCGERLSKTGHLARPQLRHQDLLDECEKNRSVGCRRNRDQHEQVGEMAPSILSF